MKSYTSFDDFVKDQTPEHRRVIDALRTLVKQTTPALEETVKWGNGCWVNENLPIAFVHAANDHVQFGFFGGSLLKDPKHILEGSGKFVRHVKIDSTQNIDKPTLTPLIRQAAITNYKVKKRL